jgi:GNAT superfamily N-acetyltransferase
MLVACLTFSTAGWTIQPATDTATVRSVAGLSIDQFEKLQLPLLPLPGWEERARTAAVAEWTASRQVMLGGSQPHALLVASRNEAEQGRYFEGVDDSLLGFAELGLLPAPPEQPSGWPGESRDSEESTAAALTSEGANAATAAAASDDDSALFPYLANLAVKAGARRLGLGKALVVATEQRAAELGYGRMYIKVVRARDSARARRVLAAVPRSLDGAVQGLTAFAVGSRVCPLGD